MSVTKPASGTIITKGGIELMHSQVATPINAQTPAELERGALRDSNSPSLVVGADGLEVTAPQNVTVIGKAEPEAYVLTAWQELFGFRLDNTAAGYVLPPCHLLYWVTIQPQALFNVGARSAWDTWGFCLYHEEDVGAGTVIVLDEFNERFVFGHSNYEDLNDPVTIFVYHDATAYAGNWTLEAIKLKACKLRADPAAGGNAPDAVVLNGSVGFVALYSGS